VSCEDELAAFRQATDDLHRAQFIEETIRSTFDIASFKLLTDAVALAFCAIVACPFAPTVVLSPACIGCSLLAAGRFDSDLFEAVEIKKALAAAEKTREQAQSVLTAALQAYLNCKTPPWPPPNPTPDPSPPARRPGSPPPTTNLTCEEELDRCQKAAIKEYNAASSFTFEETQGTAWFATLDRIKAAEAVLTERSKACQAAYDSCVEIRWKRYIESLGTPT